MNVAKLSQKEYDKTIMENEDALPKHSETFNVLLGILIFAGLYFLSRYNYLLFHSLAEIFSIVIAGGIFVVIWNSRRFMQNGFFLFIGISFFFIAGLDLLHTLAFKGMGVFAGYGTNLATQLWLGARYTQAITFAIAPLFLQKKIKAAWAFFAYAAWTGLLLLSIFYWKIFPVAYIDGSGLTPFKIVSEYFICLILLGAIVLLADRKDKFKKNIFSFLIWSIIATIAAELSFTLYTDVYGFFNALGHFLKIISFYLIYRAVIVTSLKEPYSILFKELKQSEQKFRSVVQTASDAVIATDQEAKIIFWNEKAETIFGYSVNEILGKPVSIIVPQSLKEAHVAGMYRVLSGGQPKILGKTVEVSALKKDGAVFPVELSLAKWEEKGQIFFTAIIRDITQRKQTEEKINHLASFPQLNTNPVLEVNASGKIIYSNPATQNFLEKKGLAKESASLFIPQDVDEILNILKQKKDSLIYRDINIKENIFRETIHLIPQFNVVRIYALDITENKRAEQELIKLKRSVDSSGEAIFLTDKEGIITFINSEFTNLYGYQPEEIIGKYTPRILKSGLLDEKEYEKFWKKITDKQIVRGEIINKKRGGDKIYVQSTVNPVLDEKNNIIGFLAIQRDISENKKMEEAVKQSEQKFRNIVETTLDGILTMDVNNKITYANNTFAEMLGYSTEDLLGKHIFKFIAEEEIDRMKNLKEDRRQRGIREKRLRKKDGSYLWVIESMSPLLDKDSKHLGNLSIITDISRRKIAEEEREILLKQIAYESQKKTELVERLDQEKAKDEALLSSIGHGIVAVDNEAKVLFANKAFENLSGLKIAELFGKSLDELIELQDEKGNHILPQHRLIWTALNPNKKEVVTSTSSCFIISKDKSRLPVTITAAPIIQNGKIIGAISVYRDVTRERQIDRAKSEFVSLASHQLRTPLASISLSSEMLIGGIAGELSKEQKKYLRTIYSSVREMTDLIETLLNVSRIEMGTLFINPQSTNLSEFINKELDNISIQIKDKQLTLKKSFDEDIPQIDIDQRLMKLIIDNLFSNAIKYTKNHDTINVEVKKREHDVLICVSDTGCGIPVHQHGQIFSKLFRADNQLKSETKGTGLGLYIVKAAVKQYGGKVWFESEENKGTAFYVTVPLKGMKKKDRVQENLFASNNIG